MQTVQVLDFYSTFYRIPAHENMLLSASIFINPVCPKCSASTICLFNSSGIKIYLRQRADRIV